MTQQTRKPRGPRFNFMWFWAIVTVGILYFAMFGEEKEQPLEGDWDMITGLVENGLIERIDVVDQEKASVYLKKSLIDTLAKDERFKGMPTTGAQIRFNTGGEVQDFREQIERAEQKALDNGIEDAKVKIKYLRTEKGIGEYIFDALPWILMIAIWFFIMRGMMKGAGGGGGGKADMAQAGAKDPSKIEDAFKVAEGLL